MYRKEVWLKLCMLNKARIKESIGLIGTNLELLLPFLMIPAVVYPKAPVYVG